MLDSSMFFQPERQWYAVYTKPQKEDYAEYHLRTKGLEVFLPKLRLPQSVRQLKRVVALFPNYLFVRMEHFSHQFAHVNWSPGVKHLVSFNGSPASIDNQIIAFLMQQSDSDGIISARSNLRAGQEVHIKRGPFNGLVGIIQEPPNARGRVQLLLNLLSRPTKVEVPVEFIDASWIAAGSRSDA